MLVVILSVILVASSMARGANTIHVPGDQPTIQAAINAASNGDTVLVAPGTYQENINFNGKAITVTSSGGPQSTIIDGGHNGSVVTFNTGEASTSVLNGFTIQNGFATNTFDEGGGLFIYETSPTITNNIITNNQACSAAGLAIDYGASPLIQGNTITQNNQGGCSGGTWGGGIGIHAGGSPQIIGNIITNNSIEEIGGGIGMFIGGTPTIENNFISGNTSDDTGGGIGLVNDTLAKIVQNVIVGNSGTNGGGGVACSVPDNPSDNCFLINNTISNNITSSPGSEVLLTGFDQQVQIVNNVVFGNSSQIALFCDTVYSQTPPALSFNDVFNSGGGAALGGSCTAYAGTNGNISADPLFLDPARNFHLLTGSPAINAGNNSAPNLPAMDFDGNARITNGAVDMGAYEYLPATMSVSATSLTFGPTPFGTRGAGQPLTITNSGANPLYLSLKITGDFTETDNCSNVLAANAHCTVNIVFDPTDIGTRTGSLILASNAANGLASVGLTGIATGANVQLSAATLTFATQLQGTASTPQVVTVTNSGTLPLIVSTITASAGFTQTNTCSTPIGAGASCNVSVSFAPTSNGAFAGSLTLVDNAPGSPHTVGLTGIGYAYPIPVLDPPLQPASAIPGTGGFTLTIHGMGFVDSSVVYWNQSPLTTTFVSSTQLTVQVPAANVAAPGTAIVKVVNPTPVGGASDGLPFEITTSTATLAFVRTDLAVGQSPLGVAQADFNGDGKPDLAVANMASGSVSILLGNGNGAFSRADYATGVGPVIVIAADFNGDRKPDLAVINSGCPASDEVCGASSLSILLGNGDGTLQAPLTFSAGAALALAAGDFNGDGKIDLAVYQSEGSAAVTLYLGNGDGTFAAGSQTSVGQESFQSSGSMVADDFNGDGKLDIAVTNPSNNDVVVMLGKGDGTFQNPATYATGETPGGITAGDFNGDGIQDLATTNSNSLSVLLGNGDGSFQPPTNYATGNHPWGVAAADMNGDGHLDLAVTNFNDDTVSVFLGDGSGAFLARQDFSTGVGTGGLAAADFNGDGRMDLATANFQDNTLSVLLQTARAAEPAALLSPSTVTFPAQPTGSTSGAQAVALNNTGTVALAIASIAVTGDFAETDNCGTSVAAGGDCTINITFTPSLTGSRGGTLTVTDNSNGAAGNTQSTALSGTGTGSAVSLSSGGLTFMAQMSGSSSTAQNVTLSNTGNAALAITSIASNGDFSQTNTCGTSVAAGGNCTIAVTFKPTAGGTRSGTIAIADNAPGSPQTVNLSGTGEDFTVAPPSGSSSSATVAAGQPANYTLSVGGEGGMSGTVSFTCTGAPTEATCTVSPNPVTVGNSATNVSVNVTTTAPSLLGPSRRFKPTSPVAPSPGGPLTLTLLLAATVWLVVRATRPGQAQLRSALLPLGLGLILALAFVACGGGGGGGGGGTLNPGTPAGSYTLTVTGTTGSGTAAVSHRMTLTLVVQ